MMDRTDIADRVRLVRERVARAAERVGRDPATVLLVAVSKTKGLEEIRQALEAGITALGENYVQEMTGKMDLLEDQRVDWHLIGHLQTNKARQVAGRIALFHALDSLPLAKELDKRATKANRRLPVCIQVNVAGEEQKSGVDPVDLRGLVDQILTLEHLELRGLMVMPPFFDDPELSRPFFKELRRLRDEEEQRLGRALADLSMGMSQDFEVAVEEGSTMVRVGSTIFGARS